MPVEARARFHFDDRFTKEITGANEFPVPLFRRKESYTINGVR